MVSETYGAEHVRFDKSATDFATQTDLDAEAAILDVLSRHRPGDARTGEESGATATHPTTTRRWLVDPLCGTLNFAARTPLAVVNVALLDGGTPLAAVAADPIADETFWTDGARAFLRNEGGDNASMPSSRSGLVEINCDGPFDRPFVGGQLVTDPRLRAQFGPRVISSSLGLAWVAAGRRAAYVSDGTMKDSVHFAAGLALCEATGCVVSSLDGGPLHAEPGLIVSADQETHNRMVELVAPHLHAARSAT